MKSRELFLALALAALIVSTPVAAYAESLLSTGITGSTPSIPVTSTVIFPGFQRAKPSPI